MKISYAITVCNEVEEIKKLISFLLKHKREEDEIIVQQDCNGLESLKEEKKEIFLYLDEQVELGNLSFTFSPLNNHFANFKNNLNSYCTGDYIFQIDADELPNQTLIETLPDILSTNSIDLLWVPRINTVEGLTQEHIQKWRWRVDQNGWVNFPDFQSRIYKNSPEIKWVNKVHEKVVGVKEFAYLPQQEEYCLYHPKDIKRQEKQNRFYSEI